jgi:Bifunctional DNA primase/polymerase, N-terminal/Primase C terminal 1 (PriCT-1)
VSVFQQWQPIYAEHNIPTFPVTPTKTPAVTNYTRMGLPASKALTSRFQNAMALGFMCGRRTKVVLADVDTTDERVLTDFMDRHGKTPVVSRSASGGLHGWYRHNGEGRHIKPFPGLPIDILGGGFAVAPPSQTEKGKYQFIAGGLDDLDRLPTLQNLGLKPVTTKITKLAGMREHDGRNNALFRELGRAAHQVDDFDQLLDCARTKNEQCAQPMEDKEVMATAASVWKMQEEGRNRFGQHGAWFPVGEIAPWAGELDAFFLLAYLRGNNRPGATFMVTNSLADKFGWWVRRLAAARTRLIELGHIRPVRQAGKGHAALFRWTNTKGGENPPPILN